ncbi:serine/threonine-protein kinase [Corynebacterium sp. H113]|uniref:serine/threonine-protein kinase n=1 Tax=Corynebacterium sp. H113 TaxID=3133419 RepID=UPI00309A86DD
MDSSDRAFIAHLEQNNGLTDIAEIGRGAMGIVYSATDTNLGRKVAVKRLMFDLLSDEASEKRFRSEMKHLAALRHEAIIRIYTGNVSPGVDPYFVMEFVEGSNLREEIVAKRERNEHYTVAETCRILRPVAAALDYIHRLNPPIIHRDVKPANILRPTNSHGAESILADFGISSSLEDTTTGTFLGTLMYSAPEAFMSLDNPNPVIEPTAASDNYALALIAFEMLTTKQLCKLMSDAQWRGSRPTPNIGPVALHQEDGASAEAVTAVFSRGLANLPRDRFGTCVEFINALEAAGKYNEQHRLVPDTHIGAGGTVDATLPMHDGGPYPGTAQQYVQQPYLSQQYATQQYLQPSPQQSAYRTSSFPTSSFQSTSFQTTSHAKSAQSKKNRAVGIIAALSTIIAVVAGVIVYMEEFAWSSAQKPVAGAFDSAIPNTRVTTETWSFGGQQATMKCAPVMWSGHAAIRCRQQDGDRYEATFVDFGNEELRDSSVTGLLGGESGWKDNLTKAVSSGCSVGVLTTESDKSPATIVLPEQERAQFLAIFTGEGIHDSWTTLPLCG